MILKQIGLVALAATFIAGSAAVANAESNISGSRGAGGSLSTSSALQSDWASGQAAPAMRGPSTGAHAAYGYAREHRSAKNSRANVKMKHNN